MPDPLSLVLKSLKDFKSNLIILVPILLSIGLYLLWGIFVFLQIIIGVFLFRDASFSIGVALYAGLFFIIDLIAAILINSYITAAQYGVMADAVLTGKSSFKRLLQHGKTFFKPVLTFVIAKFVVLAAPLALLALIAFAVFQLSSAAGYLLAFFFGLLYVIFLIAFYVITVFNIPILVSTKVGGFKLIINSFKYGKSNLEHVAITVAVVIVLWIVSSLIYMIVYIPSFIANMVSELMPGTGAAISLLFVSLLFNLLSSLVSAICGIIISLFIFNSYFSKNPVKNWK